MNAVVAGLGKGSARSSASSGTRSIVLHLVGQLREHRRRADPSEQYETNEGLQGFDTQDKIDYHPVP